MPEWPDGQSGGQASVHRELWHCVNYGNIHDSVIVRNRAERAVPIGPVA
jgi:hypothetical protein